MRNLVYMPVILFVSLALLPQSLVSAENICDIGTAHNMGSLPQYSSVNSSMLLIIPEDTVSDILGSLSHPMKIAYWIEDDYSNLIDNGALFRYEDCWVCEFTGKISNFYGSCGPTPFRKSGNFLVTFYAQDFEEEERFNRTIIIHSETISVGVNVDDDGTAKFTVDAPINTDSIWMSLYDAETGDMVTGYNKTALEASNFQGRYLMDMNDLEVGIYYAAFSFRTTLGKTGGGLSKFEITSKEIDLEVKTDSQAYWIGQDVIISGQTTHDTVTATVRRPSGRTETLSRKTVSDDQYSYTFNLPVNFEEGKYSVTVNAGTDTEETSFDVLEAVEITPISLTYTITNRSSTVEKILTIKNVRNISQTFSASTQGITSYATTHFDKTTVSPQSTAKLTVRVNPAQLQASTTGSVVINTGATTVSIPVALNLNIGTGPTTGAEMLIDPPYWEVDNCLEFVEVSSSVIIIENTGTGTLSSFGFTLSDDLEDITEVTLPTSVSQGDFESVDISITPDDEQISGWVEVTSNGGSQKLYVSLGCYDDISSEIESMESEITMLQEDYANAGYDYDTIYSLFSLVEGELESATLNMENGDYEAAQSNYQSAVTRLSTLGNVINTIGYTPVTQGGGGDMTAIIIAVIVIFVIAVLAYFLYTKYSSRMSGGEGEEEQYEEELY